MKNLFERTSSNWVRYSEYEWRATKDGTLYLTPTKTAQPSIYAVSYTHLTLGLCSIAHFHNGSRLPALPHSNLTVPARASLKFFYAQLSAPVFHANAHEQIVPLFFPPIIQKHHACCQTG